MRSIVALRALVWQALHHRNVEFSVQGFGMMRTYLDSDKEWRLNVWDSSLQVPGVSTIHDHPWHFDSWVISGEFYNNRFLMTDEDGPTDQFYDYMEIKTGEGGGPTGERKTCRLSRQPTEFYAPGSYYHQDASEIHETRYRDGAVTLNRRKRVGTGEHARVFWPHGEEWVDAMPRPATPEEVRQVLGRVEDQWNA